jgi:DNA-binding NtrC family response regulator
LKVRPPAGHAGTVPDTDGHGAEKRGVAAAENGPGRTGADSECRRVSEALAAGRAISGDELARARTRDLMKLVVASEAAAQICRSQAVVAAKKASRPGFCAPSVHDERYPVPAMTGGSTTLDASHDAAGGIRAERLPEVFALTLVWTASEPERLGETLLLTNGEAGVFGRGGAPDEERENRIVLQRQRPGENQPAAVLENPFLSRVHLRIEPQGEGLLITALGKRPLRIGDLETGSVQLFPGDLFEIRGLYSFLLGRRPAVMREGAAEPHAFGEADGNQLVGEGVAAWSLREQIVFCAQRGAHVLITGPTGTGKELVAQAIHECSPRKGRKLVARNAATFPSGLIDAELFGNVANYPNAGMPERPGLIGQAEGSTLLLDEIGELSADLQAHLLRVMDGGDYHRLGEARRRTADVRFIAATNRMPEQLKSDLLARFGLRLHVSGLGERREDICLLARHLLRRIAAKDPQLGRRFFSQWDGRRGEPRLSAALARALTLHDYSRHTRELEALLWRALATSPGTFLDLTVEVEEMLQPRSDVPGKPQPLASPEVTADEVRQALARHAGVKDRVWRELGLPSRHALRRLIQKYGIDADEPETG